MNDFEKGMEVRIKIACLHWRYLGDKNPKAEYRLKDVILLRGAEGTEYAESDWVVHPVGHPEFIFGIKESDIYLP